MRSFPGKVLLLTALLALPEILFAIPTDTIKPNTKDTIFVRHFKANQFFNPQVYTAPDTSLNGLQRYFVKNSIGNPGSAISPLILQTEGRKTGFAYWNDPFEFYQFREKKIDYFLTRTPYTNLYLAVGTKEEQYFKGVHSQNVTPRLNFAAGFERLRSGGDYLRQTNTHTGAFLSSNYRSKKQRYLLLGNVSYNNLKSEENGGIKNDTAFKDIGFGDKKVLGVNLFSAERRIWRRSAFVKQYFGYGSLKGSTDTLSGPKGYFTHSFLIEDNDIAYHDDDPDPNFYPAILRDSLQTRDSTHYIKLENRVGWCVNDKNVRTPVMGLDLVHQYIRVKQNEIDSVINNLIGEVWILNKWKQWEWGIRADYAFAGSNKGDVSSRGWLNKSLMDTTALLRIEAGYSNESPVFMYNRYSSNHFEWSYDWENTQQTSASASFNMTKYHFVVGASVVQYNSPMYFDLYARPKQYDGSITAMSAFVKKDIYVGNWVFANHVIYQYIPDSSIIRLPKLVTDHSIYYEDKVFNNALKLQAGVDVFYTSSFFGNAYMPATSQFYLQNETKIGNYPYVDVFVNFKIRTVRAFLKYEHVNAGLLGNVYFMTPHYPMSDGSFLFGLSWDFYN